MPTLSEVFLTFGQQYLDRFASAMLPGHKKAIWDIVTCRTGAKGGRMFKCNRNKCRHLVYVYHSCCNRSCPQCHGSKSQSWLEKRKSELLDVPYFHVVFTLPKQIRPLVRSNQRVMYNILFKAAVYALQKLAADPKYLGGKVAALAVLHTSDRALGFHPHLHCLVPAVAISKDKKQLILPKHRNYLVPVRALSKIFRARFLKLAKKELPIEKRTDDPLNHTPQKWVVYSKSTLHHTENVLEYLARYIYRTAITNRRIISIDSKKQTVTFKYQAVGSKGWRPMPLSGSEFIRRFLQHVLPKGFHKVRHYGFLSPTNRECLKKIQTLLLLKRNTNADQLQKERNKPEASSNSGYSQKGQPMVCPKCGKGHMVEVMRLDAQSIPYKQRPPPWLTLHATTRYKLQTA